MDCRLGCGACCSVPSISSPTPADIPNGKPAGVRCVQLTDDNRCRIVGQPDRLAVCRNLHPSLEMCGTSDDQAYAYLAWLDQKHDGPPKIAFTTKFLPKHLDTQL